MSLLASKDNAAEKVGFCESPKGGRNSIQALLSGYSIFPMLLLFFWPV